MANIQERTTKSGQTRYRVQVRSKGKPTISKTFKPKTDAKRWGQEKGQEINTTLYFRASESEKHVLDDAISRYIRDIVPRNPKSGGDYEQQLLVWKKRIGKHRLSVITTPLISQHRDELKLEFIAQGKHRSPPILNRYLACLSHLYFVLS